MLFSQMAVELLCCDNPLDSGMDGTGSITTQKDEDKKNRREGIVLHKGHVGEQGARPLALTRVFRLRMSNGCRTS